MREIFFITSFALPDVELGLVASFAQPEVELGQAASVASVTQSEVELGPAASFAQSYDEMAPFCSAQWRIGVIGSFFCSASLLLLLNPIAQPDGELMYHQG